jgi:cytochrome P450
LTPAASIEEIMPMPKSDAGRVAAPSAYAKSNCGDWSYSEFQREPLTFFKEPYRRFGPLFSLRFDDKETLILAGPEANDFVSRNKELWAYGKAFKFIKKVVPRDLITLDAEEHSTKRRRMLPSFRLDLLDRQVERMRTALRDLLMEHEGRPVDLRDLLNLSFFRQTCAALDLAIDDRVFHDVLLAEQLLLEGTVHDTGAEMQGGFRDAFMRVKDGIRPTVEKRLSDLSGDDMFSAMVRAHVREAEPLFDTNELVEDIGIFLLAGIQNGAHVILWSLLLMHRHPQWREAVAAELRGRGVVTATNLADMARLNAVVLEAERLRPPLVLLPRVPQRPFEFGGYTITGDLPILHAMTLVHFLEELYPDPLAFQPERHLAELTHPATRHSLFGMGPHRCVGMPLARHQAALTLQEILVDWRLEFDFEPSLAYVLKDNLTPIEEHLPVRFRRP